MHQTLHLSRRSFLKNTLAISGLVAGSGLSAPFMPSATQKRNSPVTKSLYATTDFFVNSLLNDQFMNRSQLDDLNEHLVSIGVTRHQWIVDTIWNFYETYPHPFDLLAQAVESAHAHGLQFYAQIKPFEAGGFGELLPLSFPFPDGATAFRDLRGIYPVARPFAAQHPEMCLKRKAGTYKATVPVTTIRLVKSNDRPTRLKAEHLSLWTSTSNNHFTRYTGPMEFRETTEWRFRFPKWRPCRILYLDNLQLGADQKYLLIKSSLADDHGDFSNENGNIIELSGENGKEIPFILGKGPVSLDKRKLEFYQTKRNQLLRYMQSHKVKRLIDDPVELQRHYTDFYDFNRYHLTDHVTLDSQGYIAVACGKPEYYLGTLHPIYPEVREHWLELVRFCLDRNVDGINFRVANHTRLPESWEYGFNELVLQASGGRTDYPVISRINGDAYTQFLREARDLIKSRGKSITLHLHAGMLASDDRRQFSLPVLPPNFEWQWQTWVKEIADELEFRGAHTLRPWNLARVLEILSAVTRAADKPLHYQSDFHSMTNDEGRKIQKLQEIELVNRHAGLYGFVLYETANLTTINSEGRVVLRPYVREIFDRD
jgi:hypothetical protein